MADEHTYLSSYDESIPTYGSPPIYIEKMQACISFGTYVKLTDGRLAQIWSRSETGINVTLLSKLVSSPPFQESSPLIEGLNEVTATLESATVSCSEIEDLIFVLHPQKLIEEGMSAYGIDNLFLCRFREMPSKTLMALASADVSTFPSEYDKSPLLFSVAYCYSRHIWNDLLLFQQVLRRALSSYSLKQGTRDQKVDKVLFSCQGWAYL